MKILSNSSLERAILVTAAFTIVGSCLARSRILGYGLRNLLVVSQEAVLEGFRLKGEFCPSFEVCLGQWLKLLSQNLLSCG